MNLVQDAVHLLLIIRNTDPFVSDSCGLQITYCYRSSFFARSSCFYFE